MSLVKKTLSCIFALSLSAQVAFASQEYKLLETYNDAGIPRSDMYLITDDAGNPEQLKVVYPEVKSLDEAMYELEMNKNLVLEMNGASNKANDRIFDVEELYEGVTIVQMSGFDVVVLKAEGLDPQTGGTIVLNYLENGMTRQRSNVRFGVARNATGAWEVLYNGKKVTKVSFYKKVFLGQAIGIKSVVVD